MSLRENSATSTDTRGSKLPDFPKVQQTYTKRLLLGRHPRSFPRQSELWHHCNTSSERLQRIGSGHKLWNVVDESEEKMSEVLKNMSMDDPDKEKASMSSLPASEKKKQLESINGIAVDMKANVRIHFGMSFFIMNYMDEVLCVNKWDEILSKPMSKLDPTDRITFKLIDLDDPTNPGAIKYGRPIWMQVIDNSADGDNTMQNGCIVGAQLFNPPDMGSVQKSTGHNTDHGHGHGHGLGHGHGKHLHGHGRGGKGHGHAHGPGRGGKKGMSSLLSDLGSSSSSTTRTGTKVARSRTDSAAADDATDDGVSSVGDQSQDSDATGVTAGTGTGASSDMEDDGDKGKVATRKSTVADTVSASKGKGKDKKRSEKEMLEICGGLKAIKITGNAGKEGEGPGSGAAGAAHYKGYRNRNAWHLGQWVCRSALRDQKNCDAYVNALSPIFMEQDLYCLASSMGSSYEPWPKRAQDPRLLKMRRMDANSTASILGGESSGLEKGGGIIPGGGGGGEMGPGGGDMGGQGDDEDDDMRSIESTSSLKKSLEIAQSDAENFDHGCLRRVVKRGLPYEHIVDRRCVWRFCIADSAGDLKLLSAKEQIAQKIMRRARAVLERSKRNRTGGTRIYQENAYKELPLVGGETFPRMLREMTSEHALEKESAQLTTTRQSEMHVTEHFSELFNDIDVHKKRKSRTSSCRTKKPGQRLGSLSSTLGASRSSSRGNGRSMDDSASDYDGGGGTFLTSGVEAGGSLISGISSVDTGNASRRSTMGGRGMTVAAKLAGLGLGTYTTSGVGISYVSGAGGGNQGGAAGGGGGSSSGIMNSSSSVGAVGNTRQSVRFQDSAGGGGINVGGGGGGGGTGAMSSTSLGRTAEVSAKIASAVEANLAAARQFRTENVPDKVNQAVDDLMSTASLASSASMSTGRGGATRESGHRFSVSAGGPGGASLNGSSSLSSLATAAGASLGSLTSPQPGTPGVGFGKPEVINPLSSYGAAMAEIHRTFAQVNNKITKNYIAVGDYKGNRGGADNTAGRTNAIAGEGASFAFKMALKLNALKEEDQMVQCALNHQERVNQYKHISEIFDEFIAPPSAKRNVRFHKTGTVLHKSKSSEESESEYDSGSEYSDGSYTGSEYETDDEEA